MATLTIKATELRSLLTAVIPMADTGDTLPLLAAIRLQAHGGYVIATATDRFILGMKRAKAEVDGDLDAVLPLPAARSILAIFKSARHHDPELILTFTDHTVKVETGGGMEGLVGASMTWNLQAGPYPKVSGVVLPTERKAEGELTDDRHFNAHFLAKFAHAAVRNEPMSISYHGQMLMVRIGSDFVGALMGVRKSGNEDSSSRDAESWAAFAKADEEATEARKAAKKSEAAA